MKVVIQTSIEKVMQIHAANEAYGISLGADRTYNAPAAGPVNILQPDGKKRTAMLADFVMAIKLYETNPAFMVNGTVPCQPSNVPAESFALLLHYVTLLHSEKALLAGTGDYAQSEAVVNLTRARFNQTPDQVGDTPYVFGIINTNSPLQLHASMTECFFTFLK